MQHNNFTNIPFGSFLRKLQLNGFELSVKTILEIENIIITKQYRNAKWKNKELKYIIAPLIAKNKEEQKRIYAIVDEELTVLLQHTPIYKTEDSVDSFLRKSRRFLKSSEGRYLLVLLLFIVSFLLIITLKPALNNKPTFATKPTGDSLIVAPIDTASAKPINNIQHGKIINETKFKVVKDNGFVIKSANPITPSIANVALPVTIIFGILIGIALHFFVFYKRRKIVIHQNKDESDTTDAFENGLNNKAMNAALQQAGNIFNHKQINKLALSSNVYSYGYKPLQLLHLQKKIKEAAIKTRSDYKEEKLNINQTINKTIKNAGYISLQYTTQNSGSSLAVFMDENQSNKHLQYLQYLICDIVASHFVIEIFTFNNSLQKLYDVKAGRHIKFHQLMHDKKFSQAILFSTEDFFVETYSGNNSLDVIQFNQPNITALNNFVKTIFISSTGNFNFLQHKSSVHFAQKIVFTDLYITHLIAAFDSLIKPIDNIKIFNRTLASIATVKEAKQLLNDTAFQALCAIAVYPKLNFLVSYNIFKAVLENEKYFTHNDHSTEYNLFLSIIKLPWFRLNELPNETRNELLQQLSRSNEIAARKCLVQVLQVASFKTNGSQLKDFYKQQVQLNNLLLQYYLHDAKNMPQEKLQELRNLLHQHNETVIARNIETPVVDTKKKIQKFSFKDEFSISFARASILLIPPCIIYAGLTKFKPHQIYNYEEGSMYNNSSITLTFLRGNCANKWIKVFKESSVDVDINMDSIKTYLLEKQYSDSILISYNDSINKTEYQTKLSCTFSNYSIEPKACSK